MVQNLTADSTSHNIGSKTNPLFINDTDFQLQSLSPAIDAGNNSVLPIYDSLDLEGNQRISHGTVDMGAYEYQKNKTEPITLENFSGILVYGIAHLQWTTGLEINFSHFEVQKSQEGKTFLAVSIVSSKGNNSNYSLSLNQIEDKAYYRLKTIDNDGSISYSSVIMLTNGKKSDVIYPNPAHTNVNIIVAKSENIYIYSTAGKLVKIYHAAEGINTIDIRDLINGIYYVISQDYKMEFIKN